VRSAPPLLAMALAVTFAPAAFASSVDTSYPTIDTPTLQASAVSGDTVFLGGFARWVGPLTGGGVPVSSGDMSPLTGFPHVNGHVLCATADGTGGWYIGGSFTDVGGAPHVNLAHIRSDLTVEAWNPATNGDVITIVATASEVWIGGTFTSVNGQPSSGFASLSRVPGTTVFNPPMGGLVAALATDGTNVYLSGDFSTANGVARTRTAAFRLSDHALTSWTAAANAAVNAMRFANGYVYAGGDFSTIAGQSRGGAAALDPLTAQPSAWNPQMGSFSTYGVRALLAVGNHIYLGGGFTQMGGTSRVCLAAVDTSSGALTSWDPQLTDGATVTSLESAGADVVAGGTFGQVGGATRLNLARIDAATGALVPGAPEVPGEARALAMSGSNLLVGGRFASYGGVRRSDLIAVRASTGEVLPWAPDATRDGAEFVFGSVVIHPSSITSMSVDDARVYVGLSIYVPTVGAASIVYAFSRATGAKQWEYIACCQVNALAVHDSSLFIGGDFDSPSRAVIAVRTTTGAEIPWGVAVDAKARALQVTPAGLAVGGEFTSLGGQPRNDLAMLDLGTGLATSWDPQPNGPVWSLALAGNTLFCGGDFTAIGGQSRSRLAALALDTGTPDAWNPGANSTVRTLDFEQGVLLAGGGFTTIGGQPRTSLAAVNPSSGAVLPLDAGIGPGHSVLSVTMAGGRVFASGSQTTASAEPTLGLTVVVGPDPLLGVDGPGARAGRPVLLVTPQPARSAAQIRLRLPRAVNAELGVYDLAGRRIMLLSPRAARAAGEHAFELATRRLPSGLYLVRASTTDGDATAKLVVLQ